jgi:CheY-like chemotaxis protein
LNPFKVAVVDDDQIYQFIINRSLTKLHPDSKILNFSNCADFFNFLTRNRDDFNLIPDVVLLDLNTPFMSAWEFLTLLEDLKPNLQKIPEIFLVTSSIDPHDEEQAAETPGLAGFYCKPLMPEQLEEIFFKINSKTT